MADFVIKPSSGDLVLKDDQNAARLTVAGTTGATTLSGATTLANATVTAGTIASAVNLNHDAKKNAWSRFTNGQVDISSAAVVDFGGSGFIGSGITESSGRMTCTVAGLYLIMLNMSQHHRGNRDLAFNLRKNASNVPGFYIYEDSASDGTYYNGSASIIMLDIAANDILDIYGTGNYSGHSSDSQTCFSGVRLGASS